MNQVLDELGDQGVPTDGSAPEHLTFWGRPVALVPLDRIVDHSLKASSVHLTAHGSETYVEELTLTVDIVHGDKLAGSYRKAVLDQVDPSKRGDDDA